MKFEWNEAKSRGNLHKHGLDFADAHEVFRGPMLARPDTRHEYGEKRWIAMGFLRNRVVVLAFVEQNDEVIRIVSMRKANRHEREAFEKAVQD